MTVRRSSEDDGEVEKSVSSPHDHHRGQGPPQALECPRCQSLNTKFCYYNNYRLSQPRYFCKSCRKYWTKGRVLRKTKGSNPKSSNRPQKPKTHDCSICGLEFAIGQALGGHMWGHREDANDQKNGRPDDKDLAMVNCLMLLSRARESVSSPCLGFSSGFKPFQPLGGHRMSQKTKAHDCSICGLMFAMGLALGGRIRRHRDGERRVVF